MNSFYFDFDCVNMIMTINYFDGLKLIRKEKLEFSNEFITEAEILTNGKTEKSDISGMIIEDRNIVKDGFIRKNEIKDFHIREIIDILIIVKNEEEREIVKLIAPDYYCVIGTNIDKEMREALTIYKKT